MPFRMGCVRHFEIQVFRFYAKEDGCGQFRLISKRYPQNWKKVQKKDGQKAILFENIIDPKSNYGYIPRFFVAKATRLIATM